MSRNSDLNLLLDRIRLYDLEIYLEKLRWSVAHSKNGKWKKYRLDDGAQLELIIPENENLVDAKMRISQIIEALSQIYDVNQRKICADIIGTSSDSLLIHLNIERHKSTIPLESVPKHVTALKNLILYSACSEIEALPFFERPPSKADGMLGGFEFCHTFAGSFGFEVSATIVKPQETQDFFGSPSRRIVERIARGVKLLDMAVANDDPNILADNFKVAMNARMCDALADIGLEGKTNFDIEVEWASMLEPAPELKEMGLILINEPKINMLKFVSSFLYFLEANILK